ncbi:MAG: hypothetical protein VCB77_04560 [Alphaproteobacteria bacterium]
MAVDRSTDSTVDRELGALLREIRDQQLVAAVDELNENVRVTEDATTTILEEAEEIDNGGMITDSVARIYEACSFQDITGQRIGKVVVDLKRLEDRIDQISQSFGDQRTGAGQPAAPDNSRPADADLLNRPQSPTAALARARIEAMQVASATQETREASTTDLAFWDAIKDSANTADYQAYVDQFPDGTFAILARNRLAMLMAGEAPVAAQQQASLPEPAEEDPGFDGQWVLMIKGEGCPMVGRAKATVTASNSSLSGTIKVGTHGTFQLHGTILPSGKIENASLQGRYHLKLRGKFEGAAARDKWRVTNGDCSGSFSPTRAGTS